MIPVDYRNTLTLPVVDGKLDGSPLISTYHVLLDDNIKPVSLYNVSKDVTPTHAGYKIEVKFHRKSMSNVVYHFFKLMKGSDVCYRIEVWPGCSLELNSDEFYFSVGWGDEEIKKESFGYKYGSNPFMEMQGRKLHFLHYAYGSAPDLIFPYHLEYAPNCFSSAESSVIGGKGVNLTLRFNGVAKKILVASTYFPFAFSDLFLALKKAGSYEKFISENY
jgi:hypothetical protein